MDLSRLNDKEKAKMLEMMEQKQQKDSVRVYMHVVDLCFDHCINDFTSKVLSSSEDSCINKCVDKFLRHSARVGLRFNELSMQQQQQQ